MTHVARHRWLVVLKTAWNELRADRASIVASGVAFRVALALFPAMALMVWIASRTVGPGDAKALVGTVSGLLPDASRSMIGNAVDAFLRSNPVDGSVEQSWLGASAPVAGVVVTLWTANSGMEALFTALNIVYDKQESRRFLHRNLLTLVFTLGALGLIAAAAAALLASPFILSHLGFGASAAAAVQDLRWPALFVGFAPALSLLYRHAPDREREAWPLVTVGSVLAAGLLVLGTAAFSWSSVLFSKLSVTYGSLSTVVTFLLWLWFDFYVVLACAELDSIIERRTELYGRPQREEERDGG